MKLSRLQLFYNNGKYSTPENAHALGYQPNTKSNPNPNPATKHATKYSL